MAQDSPKKPYTTPTLTTYGDVRKITEAVGFSSVNGDGGTGFRRKTH
jgi:hypothetical protein